MISSNASTRSIHERICTLVSEQRIRWHAPRRLRSSFCLRWCTFASAARTWPCTKVGPVAGQVKTIGLRVGLHLSYLKRLKDVSPQQVSLQREPGKKTTEKICKVLVRHGLESNSRPTSTEADALTKPRGGQSVNYYVNTPQLVG